VRRPRRPHLLRPRYTVRLRLTMLYGAVFLLSGTVLLGIAYVLVRQTTGPASYTVKVTSKGVKVVGPHGLPLPTQFRALAPTGATPRGTAKGVLGGSAEAASGSAHRPAGGHAGGAGNGENGNVAIAAAPAAGGGAAAHLYLGTETAPGGSARATRGTDGLYIDPGAIPGGLARAHGAAVPPLPAFFPEFLQARAQARQLHAVAVVQHNDELRKVLIDLGIALAIMAIVSMGLGWFVAGRALRPLHTITRAARAISATNLHRRLSLKGPNDELRELGNTFDELLERLERSFDAQRQFVANASHELRTPLTLERAIIEVALADPATSTEALRETCRRVLAIGEQQERMIEALLTLARSERGLERREPLDLERLTRRVLDARREEAACRGVRIEADLRPAIAQGDAQLVERLVANLVDNAIRHNLASGWVRVAARPGGGGVLLTVSNSGPAVAPEEVKRLLRPFTRVGADRSARGGGHGLGLSIVQAIATAHGASLDVTARAEGGLDVRVGFPALGGAAPDGGGGDGSGAHRTDANGGPGDRVPGRAGRPLAGSSA
jgi:signal transduction histidine kinase